LRMPAGLRIDGREVPVVKLVKSLYGLKQAGRVWNLLLTATLLDLGFRQCRTEPSVFYKNSEGQTLILGVFVDDIIMVSSDEEQRKRFLEQLSRKFLLRDLGEVDLILGMRVHRSPDKSMLSLDQQIYSQGIVERAGLNVNGEFHKAATPLDSAQKLNNTPAQHDLEIGDSEYKPLKTLYQKQVGELLYLARCTRPDMMQAVITLGKYSHKPLKQHRDAMRHVMRYLAGTTDFALIYNSNEISDIPAMNDLPKPHNAVVGFSDSDFAADTVDRKSRSGYAFMMNGALVSFASKTQTYVALSTAEAEYTALSYAAQEALWITSFLSELELPLNRTIEVFDDNRAAIAIATKPKNHSATKHVDIKLHHVRDLIDRKLISVPWIPSEQNVADAFTKGLDKVKFEKFRALMGVKSLSEFTST
jgi:hypothetical protein